MATREALSSLAKGPPRPGQRAPASLAPLAPPPVFEDEERDSLLALERMLSPEDIRVVFQPIVHLEDATIFAHEALVRCRVPELQSPPKLFEYAVSTGCTGRLGRIIRQLALADCGELPVFVNVHPAELQDPWLIRPDDPIFSHDFDVYLEVTESVPMTHFDICMTVLREIRGRGGIHLVVDDLGAGYSNLKRILDLEPSVVKLDRSLIVGIEHSVRQQKLVRNVVRMCEDLSAKVVAEGIETPEEYAALADMGIHYGQGYLFARPATTPPQVSWSPPYSSVKRLKQSIRP